MPVRTPVLIRGAETNPSGLKPVASWFSGPVFSRARDIFAANMTELLDRSEDPSRMIRMIILEMEETLVEVRATAARRSPTSRRCGARCVRLDELTDNWTAKAELALSKDREDLAKQALVERQKAAEMAEGLHAEISQIEQVLRGYETDIAKLQGKLREARPGRMRSSAVRKRRHPRQGARDHARQPHRGRLLEVRAARAPRGFRRGPLRGAGDRPAWRTRSTSSKRRPRSTPSSKMKAALKARAN